jgi:exodeoxyribonuclease III
MRIVIWNCNMALHTKYEHLLALAPDIAVIPECANINVMREKAPNFLPASSIWIGDSRQKGLGVFTFGTYRAEQSNIVSLSCGGPRWLRRFEAARGNCLIKAN